MCALDTVAPDISPSGHLDPASVPGIAPACFAATSSSCLPEDATDVQNGNLANVPGASFPICTEALHFNAYESSSGVILGVATDPCIACGMSDPTFVGYVFAWLNGTATGPPPSLPATCMTPVDCVGHWGAWSTCSAGCTPASGLAPTHTRQYNITTRKGTCRVRTVVFCLLVVVGMYVRDLICGGAFIAGAARHAST
eukprot:COSAG01_NODE_332_length_18712_cov_41.424358_16_plen_198_part_00